MHCTLMLKLWEKDPQLIEPFQKCYQVAEQTMSDRIISEWRTFLVKARARPSVDGLEAIISQSTETYLEPTHSSGWANRHFATIEATEAEGWINKFRYRSAAVELTREYQNLCQANGNNLAAAKRLLFSQLRPEWQRYRKGPTNQIRDCPEVGVKWGIFGRAIRHGQRWQLLVNALGMGALLLIDLGTHAHWLQQTVPKPIFAAWARLVERLWPQIPLIATQMEDYFRYFYERQTFPPSQLLLQLECDPTSTNQRDRAFQQVRDIEVDEETIDLSSLSQSMSSEAGIWDDFFDGGQDVIDSGMQGRTEPVIV